MDKKWEKKLSDLEQRLQEHSAAAAAAASGNANGTPPGGFAGQAPGPRPSITVTEPQHMMPPGAGPQHPGQMQMQRAASFELGRNASWLPSDGSPQVLSPTTSVGESDAGFGNATRPIAGRPRRSFDNYTSPDARMQQWRGSPGVGPGQFGNAGAGGMMAAMQSRQQPMGLEIDTSLAAEGHQHPLVGSAKALSPGTPHGFPGAIGSNGSGSGQFGGAGGPGLRIGLGVMGPDGTMLSPGTAMMMAVNTPLPPSPNIAAHPGFMGMMSAPDGGPAGQAGGDGLGFHLANGGNTSGSPWLDQSGGGAFQASPGATPDGGTFSTSSNSSMHSMASNNSPTHGLNGNLAPATKSQRTAKKRTASGAGDVSPASPSATSAAGRPVSPNPGVPKRKSPS